MIKPVFIISLLFIMGACTKQNKNQQVPSDLVLIEFAAALEEDHEKFQTQPLGPNPPKSVD
jgi:hypothetical protein